MFRILFLIAMAISMVVTMVFIDQALLDQHSFRQTQTALTSFWFIEEGFGINYQTPVLGYPWEIPFEFPLYQYLVATFSMLSGLDLDMSGRLVSYVFLLACLVPVHAAFRVLALHPDVFWIFAVLFVLNPLYLYWGRSFMIETVALFLILSTFPFYLKILLGERSRLILASFSIIATLAVLQKATTAIPVLMVMAVVLLINDILNRKGKFFLNVKLIYIGIVGFLLPVLLGYAWVHFTDQVKSLNPVGVHTTSNALSAWNWGTWQQKLDWSIYQSVFIDRLNDGWLPALLTALLILVTMVMAQNSRMRAMLSVLLVLTVLPVVLFTNLHYEHNYYQVSLAVFWLMAIALAIYHVPFSAGLRRPLVVLLLLLFSTFHYQHFVERYLPSLQQEFTDENNLFLLLSGLLNENLAEDQTFVAYGFDWHSGLAYYSQRKALMLPNWFPDKKVVLSHPELFLGGKSPHAVINCDASRQQLVDDYVIGLAPAGLKQYQLGQCRAYMWGTPPSKPDDPS